MKKTYFIQTYGCQMNVHESEKLAGMLKTLGFEPAKTMQDASIILFNTCCIREGVEQKIFGNIGAVKKLKEKNKNIIVGVCGCMTQQEEIADKLLKKFSFVDIVFGTQNLFLFKQFLQEFLNTQKKIKSIQNDSTLPKECEIERTDGINAYINISYGCNNYCSYCIVPFVRGRERSRPFSEIITEAKQLIKSGKYKIITLLGQNVNSYGNDLTDGSSFAKLLTAICQIDGNFKLKFMTSHPKDLTDEVIGVIQKESKIAKVIHLPVQAGSNAVLEKMNRRYTREHYLNIVQKIKKAIPNATITTDIIVGFPGETEEDFAKTLSLIQQADFEAVFAFMYSKRKGTVAETMQNHIDLTIKRRRVNEVLALIKKMQKERLPSLTGKTYNVLIEKQEGENCIAKTDCGKTVILPFINLPTGSFADIIITKIEQKKLIGKVRK